MKRGLAISGLAALAIMPNRGHVVGVPSPVVRQGRAFSESLLGIRFHMSSSWQIARTLVLSLVAVVMVATVTVRTRPRPGVEGNFLKV